MQAPLRIPRRRLIRGVLRFLTGRAIFLLCDFQIKGRENLPASGPVILAANHFHWADPALLLYASPRQLEFIAGFRMPNAPGSVKIFPRLWGTLPAFRGGYSRSTLTGALSVLEQGGPLALFPEGGAWSAVLRRPRAGVGFLALESGAPIVPVAIENAPGLFKSWRPKVTLSFGAPLPPMAADPDQPRRAQINAAADQVMASIAALLPDAQRGIYSTNARQRQQAEIASEFPFEKEGMRGQ